jgi:hypothetical protein
MLRRFLDWLLGRSVTNLEVIVHVPEIKVWVQGQAGVQSQQGGGGIPRPFIVETGSKDNNAPRDKGVTRLDSIQEEDALSGLKERLKDKSIPKIKLGKES